VQQVARYGDYQNTP